MVLFLLSLKMDFHYCRFGFFHSGNAMSILHTHRLHMSKEGLYIMPDALTKMRGQITSWLKAFITAYGKSSSSPSLWTNLYLLLRWCWLQTRLRKSLGGNFLDSPEGVGLHLHQSLSVGGRVEEGMELHGIAALIFTAIHPPKQWQHIKVAKWFHSSNLVYHNFFQALPQSRQGEEIHITALFWSMTNHVQNVQYFPEVKFLWLIIFSITVQHYLQLI